MSEKTPTGPKGVAAPDMAAEYSIRDEAMRQYYMGVLIDYAAPYDPEYNHDQMRAALITHYQGILDYASEPYDTENDYATESHNVDYVSYLMRLVNGLGS